MRKRKLIQKIVKKNKINNKQKLNFCDSKLNQLIIISTHFLALLAILKVFIFISLKLSCTKKELPKSAVNYKSNIFEKG